MIGEPGSPSDNRRQLISRLRELIEALDARLPHLEREGEIQITTDAAALRSKAIARIARLELGREAEPPPWVPASAE
jgi:hypothetical protein